jgi:Immunoglobulin-like domain of bacterial spore germination
MRPVHIRLIAIAGALAVVLGVGTAFLTGRDNPVQPAAIATPTTATPTDVNDSAPETTRPERPVTGDQVAKADKAAKAAAVAFLRDLGMRDPVAASYRKTGATTAEVGLHPGAGEGGRPLDKVTTLVQLRSYSNGWVATGARAANIEVAQPLAFARILSPLTVSGQSVSYEGTVHVTVTQDRRGADRVLGKGFVNGGGSELAPFNGPIKFASPTPGVAGWVVFSGDTGADTGIMEATAVRVRFATAQAAPRLVEVVTSPAPSGSAQSVTLTGSGKLWIQARASGASEVRFLLVPSGTDNRPNAKLLGNAHNDGDGRWSLTWRYPDEPFTGHLLVQVNGPGGSVEDDRIALYHT